MNDTIKISQQVAKKFFEGPVKTASNMDGHLSMSNDSVCPMSPKVAKRLVKNAALSFVKDNRINDAFDFLEMLQEN